MTTGICEWTLDMPQAKDTITSPNTFSALSEETNSIATGLNHHYTDQIFIIGTMPTKMS
jgi:hypothetical protein